jgi:hypothetical protein
VPDKRQTSKQRRAARNRASRDALAARRTNAVTAATTASAASATSGRSAASSSTATGGSGDAPAAPRTFLSGLRGDRRPGDRAVLVAFALSIVSAIAVLFLRVPVDDRGEPLPTQFRGVAKLAREAVTGEPFADRTKTLLDASGPGVLPFVVLPIAVAAFAVWANRRPDRSRMLTFALLAMAGAVILSGGIGMLFLPSLITLAVASFQIRKADAPARAAESLTRSRWGRGAPIDVQSDEVVDDEVDEVDDETYTDEVDDGGAYADEVDEVDDTDEADATAAVDDAADRADPLAELEAEIEAEEETRKGKGGGAGGTTTGA